MTRNTEQKLHSRKIKKGRSFHDAIIGDSYHRARRIGGSREENKNSPTSGLGGVQFGTVHVARGS